MAFECCIMSILLPDIHIPVPAVRIERNEILRIYAPKSISNDAPDDGIRGATKEWL